MPYTILIVDDSPLIRHFVRSCVETSGDWHVCGEAENGQIAVEKVREFHPDAVILDLQMPIMNGLEAARLINLSDPHTAMVMLTMHNSSQLRKDAQAAGIKEVLSKSESVADHLNAALERIGAASRKLIPRPRN